MANYNRRHFLQSMGALSFLGGTTALSGLTAMKAHAADTTGYKAMVCILLAGGMDHADTLIPFDQPTYNAYEDVRPNIISNHGGTRDRDQLMALSPVNAADFGGRQVALPIELSEIANMFSNGDAAIVSSVGPLLEPTTRAAIDAGNASLPVRLFSHNDQQSTWMALGPEGERFGWGGKFADAVLRSNPTENPLFATITAANPGVFLAGEMTRQFRTGSNGPANPSILQNEGLLGRTDGDSRARDALRDYLEQTTTSKNNLFQQDLVATNGRAIPNTERFTDALENGVELSTVFPDSSLGRQMKAIADTINIQQFAGNSRQIFYASTGGFDTHNNQANSMPGLHSNLSQSMDAFRRAMIEIGMWNDTTVFTLSDFGRTVVENGDGTDHGWGGHHFVMGGSVAGQRIYGDIPSMNVTGDEYTRSRGRLIPTQSVEQFAATLGDWFGLDSGELASALPNLANFDQKNLGFMGGGSA